MKLRREACAQDLRQYRKTQECNFRTETHNDCDTELYMLKMREDLETYRRALLN